MDRVTFGFQMWPPINPEFQPGVAVTLPIFGAITLVILFLIKSWMQKSEAEKYEAEGMTSFSGLGCLKLMWPVLKDGKDVVRPIRETFLSHFPLLKMSLFGNTFVVLMKAEHVQALLTSQDMGHLDKSGVLYRVIFETIGGKGLPNAPAVHWKPHRKLLQQAFSFKHLIYYTETYYNKYSKWLVAEVGSIHFDKNSVTSHELQLLKYIKLATIQMLCESLLGQENGMPKEDLDDIYETMGKLKDVALERLRRPWICPDTILWRMHPLKKDYTEVGKSLDVHVKRMVENGRNKPKPANKTVTRKNSIPEETPESMLDVMLNSDMSYHDLICEMKSSILGGYESTAAIIHFMLFCLALNPEYQKKCQEEIDSVFSNPKLVTNENLSYTALGEMKYLDMCLSETLRMFPPFTMFGRKLQKPLRLDDNVVLPAETNVMLFTQSMHRNYRYFPNPEKFDPDRFTPEMIKTRHPYSYIPFSVGLRNCIGNKFAIAEAKTLVAHILRNFEVKTSDKWDSIPIFPSIVLTPERDFNFVLKKRRV